MRLIRVKPNIKTGVLAIGKYLFHRTKQYIFKYNPENDSYNRGELVITSKTMKANFTLVSAGWTGSEEKPSVDMVNNPTHYKDGGIETADFINAKGLNWELGNAVKYISRAGKKDPAKEVEDLEKAIWYINRQIKHLKDAG